MDESLTPEQRSARKRIAALRKQHETFRPEGCLRNIAGLMVFLYLLYQADSHGGLRGVMVLGLLAFAMPAVFAGWQWWTYSIRREGAPLSGVFRLWGLYVFSGAFLILPWGIGGLFSHVTIGHLFQRNPLWELSGWQWGDRALTIEWIVFRWSLIFGVFYHVVWRVERGIHWLAGGRWGMAAREQHELFSMNGGNLFRRYSDAIEPFPPLTYQPPPPPDVVDFTAKQREKKASQEIRSTLSDETE